MCNHFLLFQLFILRNKDFHKSFMVGPRYAYICIKITLFKFVLKSNFFYLKYTINLIYNTNTRDKLFSNDSFNNI